ncbi:diablo homolog, mitochondrial precursor [Xenopus laevis]|uniref:Diablo homolog, mitochondrial n=1 Tax=Xenopus laevis TaxID=8355 RepID=DBLOH_XENLA|nr:diablo homolog, mitochondrial precursor [Xenopus laevis]A4GZV0.1 RecName: Full=Diablo homolog, mitochondrial; AltName: Full=Direct IAP-binding protein with low pI; AltName: Full=Second mitochondria-derived activator of caspase; Short=Smac protein; Short=XSmac; Flags: Precursor [Xenopus laevis]CAJ19268.1 Smac protein precursor [Xenopus laevis]
MASLPRRLLWSVSYIVRESFPIVSKRNCVSLLQGSWRKVLSVGVGTSLCAIPVGQRSEPTLSSESLIKRAASLVADSSSTFLSQTTYALVESLTEYTTAVYTLISLQQKYSSLLDKINSNEESAIWQVIIGARVQINQLKEQYMKYESSWQRAVSLSEMAAEAAYQSGADQASMTVRNHIQIVQTQVQGARDQAHMAEVQLAASQTEEIKRTITEDKGNPPSGGSPRNSLSEEEDIPEAYLRED